MLRGHQNLHHVTLTIEDTVTMKPDRALQLLGTMCGEIGYSRSVRRQTWSLLRRAASQPGTPVFVETKEFDFDTSVHECMETVTSNSLCAALAARAFDAAPGTHFEHSVTEDQCSLTLEVTNAVSA